MALQLNQSGVNTGLLAGFRSAMDMPIRNPVMPDIQAFTKPYYEGLDRTQKKKIEDENLEINKRQQKVQEQQLGIQKEDLELRKEKFFEDVEAQKYINRLREVEAETMPEKVEVDKSRISLGRDQLTQDIRKSTTDELKEVREYQDSIVKIAQSTTDPEARQRLVKIYNKNPLVKQYSMEAEEDTFGSIGFKNPSVAEREMSKQSGQFVGKLAQENSAILPSNARIDTTMEMIKTLPDNVETGRLAPLTEEVGSIFGALGLNNQYVKEAKDIKQLRKALDSQSLSLLKSTFGGNPTEGEREMLLKTNASITDDKESIIKNLELLKVANNEKLESNAMQTILVQQNPDNLGTASKVVAEIQSFPKVIFKGKDTVSFYEFTEMYKADVNPEATYIDIREAWAREYRKAYNTDRYIGTNNYKKETLDFLESVDNSSIRARKN
jgi:hypothetical protein